MAKIKELTQYMETHFAQAIWNKLSGGSKSPSLEIKRLYAMQALERIETTEFDKWAGGFTDVTQVLCDLVSIGKSVFIADLSGAATALARIAMVTYDNLKKTRKWYDKANELRLFREKPIELIKEKVFQNNSTTSKEYAFYVSELLLSIVTNPIRKYKDQSEALKLLWRMCFNHYDGEFEPTPENRSKQRKNLKADKDLRKHIKISLGSIYAPASDVLKYQ